MTAPMHTSPSSSAPTARAALWLPCRALATREIVRFLRQRGRIAGALGTPLVFWLLIGSGLRHSFVLPAESGTMTYFEYSFPGAIAAILLFTAIFSTISIIDDRREGFLQGVLVAPSSRLAIVLGKTAGATILAVAQAALFMALGPLAGIRPSALGVAAGLGAMVLIALGVTALGFLIAWRMESSQGFHAIMNLLLMPMLILSGAFFPADGASSWLRWIMLANPMTYGINVLRASLYLRRPDAAWSGDPLLSLLVWLTTTAVLLGLCVKSVTNEGSKTLA